MVSDARTPLLSLHHSHPLDTDRTSIYSPHPAAAHTYPLLPYWMLPMQSTPLLLLRDPPIIYAARSARRYGPARRPYSHAIAAPHAALSNGVAAPFAFRSRTATLHPSPLAGDLARSPSRRARVERYARLTDSPSTYDTSHVYHLYPASSQTIAALRMSACAVHSNGTLLDFMRSTPAVRAVLLVRFELPMTTSSVFDAARAEDGIKV
jgi:hypothetical protein